jgi:hypothetical protein
VPVTFPSFLPRLGRTGQRPGTRRNCLFLEHFAGVSASGCRHSS